MIKYSYVKKIEGHKDSKGDLAEYVVMSHDTDSIISSHKTKQEAEKHLHDMHAHKAYSELIKVNSNILIVRYADLLPGGKGDNFDVNSLPKEELKAGMKSEAEHTPNKEIQKEIVADHEQDAIELTGKPNYYEGWLLKMEDQMKKDRK